MTLSGVGGSSSLRGGIETSGSTTKSYFSDVYFFACRYRGGNSGGLRVASAAKANLEGCTFEYNEAYNGAGLDITGTNSQVIMDIADINHNRASNVGGGFNLGQYANFTIEEGGQIYNNTAGNNGGGFYTWNHVSFMVADNTNISSNVATSGTGGGGYLGYFSNLIGGVGVTFDSNTAKTTGGGLYVYYYSTVSLDNAGVFT